MIAHTTWRDLFYKLAEAHPDCLMLNFTVKVQYYNLINENIHRGQIVPAPNIGCGRACVFCAFLLVLHIQLRMSEQHMCSFCFLLDLLEYLIHIYVCVCK